MQSRGGFLWQDRGMKRAPTFHPNVDLPLRLLAACPAYAPTPLVRQSLPDGYELLIKDETSRMGLGSFKALGGVYAVACLLQTAWEELGHGALADVDLISPAAKALAGDTRFVCASAGNHGLSVAAGARIFGARAKIFLPDTVSDDFVVRLNALGAEVVRTGMSYDDSVDAAANYAESSGALHLADGSWEGYAERPALVMEGYTILAEEVRKDCEASGEWPETVYLQAGVGGLAAAVSFMIRKSWPVQPKIVIVEPTHAPCLAESAKLGKPTTVSGEVSNMVRLDCKKPSLLALEALNELDVTYAQVTDADAAGAASALASLGFQTSPSGAAGFAALLAQRSSGRSMIIVTEGAA